MILLKKSATYVFIFLFISGQQVFSDNSLHNHRGVYVITVSLLSTDQTIYHNHFLWWLTDLWWPQWWCIIQRWNVRKSWPPSQNHSALPQTSLSPGNQSVPPAHYTEDLQEKHLTVKKILNLRWFTPKIPAWHAIFLQLISTASYSRHHPRTMNCLVQICHAKCQHTTLTSNWWWQFKRYNEVWVIKAVPLFYYYYDCYYDYQ